MYRAGTQPSEPDKHVNWFSEAHDSTKNTKSTISQSVIGGFPLQWRVTMGRGGPDSVIQCLDTVKILGATLTILTMGPNATSNSCFYRILSFRQIRSCMDHIMAISISFVWFRRVWIMLIPCCSIVNACSIGTWLVFNAYTASTCQSCNSTYIHRTSLASHRVANPI